MSVPPNVTGVGPCDCYVETCTLSEWAEQCTCNMLPSDIELRNRVVRAPVGLPCGLPGSFFNVALPPPDSGLNCNVVNMLRNWNRPRFAPCLLRWRDFKACPQPGAIVQVTNADFQAEGGKLDITCSGYFLLMDNVLVNAKAGQEAVINVQCSDVVIDGNGRNINVSGDVAMNQTVNLSKANNCWVKNLRVLNESATYGIYSNGGKNIFVESSAVAGCKGAADAVKLDNVQTFLVR